MSTTPRLRNIDKGIHMTVAAKLRERGIAADAAEKAATANAGAAQRVFNDYVSQAGGPSEGAAEGGLGAVAKWAKTLRV